MASHLKSSLVLFITISPGMTLIVNSLHTLNRDFVTWFVPMTWMEIWGSAIIETSMSPRFSSLSSKDMTFGPFWLLEGWTPSIWPKNGPVLPEFGLEASEAV